jgi:hypothetical protein
MPIYKVKPEQDHMNCPVPVEQRNKTAKRYPTVCIPVSKEIIHALEVGGEVTVTLTGKVRGLESRQSVDSDPWSNRDELRMELRVVDAEPGEASEEEPDEKEETMKDVIDKGLGYTKK